MYLKLKHGCRAGRGPFRGETASALGPRATTCAERGDTRAEGHVGHLGGGGPGAAPCAERGRGTHAQEGERECMQRGTWEGGRAWERV